MISRTRMDPLWPLALPIGIRRLSFSKFAFFLESWKIKCVIIQIITLTLSSRIIYFLDLDTKSSTRQKIDFALICLLIRLDCCSGPLSTQQV